MILFLNAKVLLILFKFDRTFPQIIQPLITLNVSTDTTVCTTSDGGDVRLMFHAIDTSLFMTLFNYFIH